MTSPPGSIYLTQAHWATMRADVIQRAPEEACGLVAGAEFRSLDVFPVENVFHSSTRYRMAPREQLRIFKLLDERDWDLLAIYHSHPNGPVTPSLTDVAEAYYPDAVQLIWSPEGPHWGCRAFLIQAGRIQEVPIQLTR